MTPTVFTAISEELFETHLMEVFGNDARLEWKSHNPQKLKIFVIPKSSTDPLYYPWGRFIMLTV